MIGTRVTPDQLTWLRVITGGIACACFAYGPAAQMAGGVVWTFSALLDRADGELARLSKRTTPSGHRFYMRADTGVSSAMFLAVGIGLRDGPFGYWAIALGVLASAGAQAQAPAPLFQCVPAGPADLTATLVSVGTTV